MGSARRRTEGKYHAHVYPLPKCFVKFLFFHLLLLFHGFHCFDGCSFFIIFHQLPLIWTWCHILSQSHHGNCTFSRSQLGVNGSLSRWAGSDHRHMAAVCWDVSGRRMLWVGRLTPRPASQHLAGWSCSPSPLNHLNTSLCRLLFFYGGGVGGLTPDEECTVRRRGGRARCDCFTKHGARAPFSGAAQTDTLCLGRGGPANTPCIFDGQTLLYGGRDPPFVPPR